MHADEVHGTRTKQISLCQPGVVVTLSRRVTVDAGLRLGRAHRVRKVRVETLRGHAVGSDRQLLTVGRLTLSVLRREHDRRRRTHRGHAVALDVALDAEHEHIITRHLRVVAGVIAPRTALEVPHFALHIGFLRQVTTEARSHPRSVAGMALHLLGAVSLLADA